MSEYIKDVKDVYRWLGSIVRKHPFLTAVGIVLVVKGVLVYVR